jgi:hypothetical protein
VEQLLSNLQHPSIQDIGTIFGIFASICALLFRKDRNNDSTHYFVHYLFHPVEYRNGLGCTTTILCSIILLASAFLIADLTGIFQIASPADHARMTVQSFYDDLNNKDYQSAYALTKDGWGASYTTFVNEYKYTEYNDVTFDSINEDFSTNTIDVFIAVKATENPPSGERISNYTFLLTVGQDNSTYKILAREQIPGD